MFAWTTVVVVDDVVVPGGNEAKAAAAAEEDDVDVGWKMAGPPISGRPPPPWRALVPLAPPPIRAPALWPLWLGPCRPSCCGGGGCWWG